MRDEEYKLLNESCVATLADDLALISLTGDDRKEWLQGQATNDIRAMEPGKALGFCLCTPTGQILTVARAWELEDRILMAVPRSSLAGVMDRIVQMVIMEDVTGEALPLRCISFLGPRALEGAFGVPSDYVLATGAFWGGRVDVWVNGDPREAASGFQVLPEASVEALRIEAGIPRLGQDITAKTLPPELGPAFEAAHVSYTKGCYTGQEVLMRIFSRGHTNRLWMGLQSSFPLTVGAELADASGAVVGVVTSVAESREFGFIGAAMVRSEHAVAGAELAISSRPDVVVSLVQMPIRPSRESHLG